MTEPMYPTGMPVALYCDFTPAVVEPLPPGVPVGTRLRAVVTERALTVAWMTPTGEVGRADVPLTAEETAGVTYAGGQAGPYLVRRGSGCSSCGAGTLTRWLPFDGIEFVMRPPSDTPYGVPPARNEITQQRYSRP